MKKRGHSELIDTDNDKIATLMATFKNLENVEESPELTDHLEREFSDIIRLSLLISEKRWNKVITSLKKENK